MKKIFLLLLPLLITCHAVAQEEADGSSSTEAQQSEESQTFHREDIILSLSYVQWNEKVNLQSGTVIDEDTANFVGSTFNAEKNFSYAKWGWAIGASLGTGKATGGGNSSLIAFQKGNQAWTAYGAYAKLYHKTSGRVSLGLVAPVIYRQISWPNDPNGYPVDSGKNINTGLLFEVNFRISKNFDFFQDIGPFSSSEGATLWRIGLGYRL